MGPTTRNPIPSEVMTTPPSPPIGPNAWGSIEVSGTTYKDVKLWPGGARGWDWNETGTSHSPGVRPEDVAEVVDAGAEVVVLTTGRTGRLGVPEPTVTDLEERGVRVEVLPTDEGIDRYNELAAGGAPVGALIHTTC